MGDVGCDVHVCQRAGIVRDAPLGLRIDGYSLPANSAVEDSWEQIT
jgi:hypothetical protein